MDPIFLEFNMKLFYFVPVLPSYIALRVLFPIQMKSFDWGRVVRASVVPQSEKAL